MKQILRLHRPLSTWAALSAVAWAASPCAHAQTVTVINLQPANSSDFPVSIAGGVQGNTQAGYIAASTAYDAVAHAALWKGTAATILDLNPAGFTSSDAQSISGGMEVGAGVPVNLTAAHALLWSGTPDSAVDLNPDGFGASVAHSLSGSLQIGSGTFGGGNVDHALLWAGTAAGVVDLNPAGFVSSEGTGISGSVEVGYGSTSTRTPSHALLWTGTAASAIDLNAFLPTGFNTSSDAYGVDDRGNVVDVVGEGTESLGEHAFLWRLTFATPAPSISGLSLSPASVKGSSSSTGTVTLTAPAPAGGVKVTQTSSDTSVATVAPMLTIPAGATSAKFKVTTLSIPNTKVVTITSSLNGSSKAAALTVAGSTPAVTVSSLTLSPTSVKGGSATSTGTITLSAPAPAGGVSIMQTSSDTSAATLASKLTIAAGVSSAKFKITTYAVATTKTVTITSALNGTAKTATLTITH